MKKSPLFILLFCFAGILNSYSQSDKLQLSTIGLYAFEPAEEQHYRFWKACGYNTLQFIDVAVSLPKEEHRLFIQESVKVLLMRRRPGLKLG